MMRVDLQVEVLAIQKSMTSDRAQQTPRLSRLSTLMTWARMSCGRVNSASSIACWRQIPKRKASGCSAILTQSRTVGKSSGSRYAAIEIKMLNGLVSTHSSEHHFVPNPALPRASVIAVCIPFAIGTFHEKFQPVYSWRS